MQRRVEEEYIINRSISWKKTATLGFVLLMIIFAMAVASHSAELFPLLLVPFVYVVFEVLFSSIYHFVDAPGLIILNGLYFIRYFILPLLTLFYDDTYISSYSNGIWLLLYEEVICAVVLSYLCKKREKETYYEEKHNYFLSAKKLYTATWVFIGIAAVVIVLRPSILSKYNLIFGLTNERLNYIESLESSSSSFDIIIVDITRLLIPASVGVYFADKYDKTSKNIYYYCSLFLSVALSVIIIKGVDRGTVILHGVAIAFLVYRILPNRRREIRLMIIVAMTLIVFYLITARMITANTTIGIARYGGIENIINYIQAYVAGIKNMDIVLTMKSEYGQFVNLATPFNDLFANVPFISHLVDSNNRCLRYFNNSYGRIGTDQVMPLIGNGLMYFGYILSPVFSIMMIRVVFWCDRKYRNSKDVFSIFVWSFTSAMLAFCHYQNLQLIMLYVSCRILPLAIVYYIFTHIRFRYRRG